MHHRFENFDLVHKWPYDYIIILERVTRLRRRLTSCVLHFSLRAIQNIKEAKAIFQSKSVCGKTLSDSKSLLEINIAIAAVTIFRRHCWGSFLGTRMLVSCYSST